MSTKKVVSILFVALVLWLISLLPIAVASAEGIYNVDAVVINFEATPWGDIEVEVIDEEGTIWGYFADIDDDIRIGDVVALTVFCFGDEEEEDDEIIDVICVGHLSTIEMIQWIRR